MNALPSEIILPLFQVIMHLVRDGLITTIKFNGPPWEQSREGHRHQIRIRKSCKLAISIAVVGVKSVVTDRNPRTLMKCYVWKGEPACEMMPRQIC